MRASKFTTFAACIVSLHLQQCTGSIEFSLAGSFLAKDLSGTGSNSTLKARSQVDCAIKCAADNECSAASYDKVSKYCTIVRLRTWTFVEVKSVALLVKVSSLNTSKNYNYHTISGAVNATDNIDNSSVYLLPFVRKKEQCQGFCESMDYFCYAYQFHHTNRSCKVFMGQYYGYNLSIDSSDLSWSLSYIVMEAGGPYRMLPDTYPTQSKIPSFTKSGTMHPQQCRQYCEQQHLNNCSLFAYSLKTSECYIARGNVPPESLLFNFTAASWVSYYGFSNAELERGTRYYFVKIAMEYEPAEKYCRLTYGATVVKVDSPDEQNFLAGVITANSGLSGVSYWLGAKSFSYPYDFRWSCGNTTINYTNWNDGEPNMNYEFCTMLWPSLTWNNLPCSGSNLYIICEEC